MEARRIDGRAGKTETVRNLHTEVSLAPENFPRYFEQIQRVQSSHFNPCAEIA